LPLGDSRQGAADPPLQEENAVARRFYERYGMRVAGIVLGRTERYRGWSIVWYRRGRCRESDSTTRIQAAGGCDLTSAPMKGYL
jgi:hypothetical protein